VIGGDKIVNDRIFIKDSWKQGICLFSLLLTIIVSSIQLALDSPLIDPESQFKGVLYYLDLITTLIFCFEGLLKMIAYGLLRNGD
jgi:hypothetical protein